MLERCGLLNQQQLDGIRNYFERNAGEAAERLLAEQLIQRGLLTPWQAQQLLAGNPAFRVGNYTLLEPIGQGGMGTVFKAEHGVMGQLVALKVLSRAKLHNPVAIQRFRREVKAAASLDHPNIVTAHDAGQVGNVHFLVMEYVEGQDLVRWLQQHGPLPIEWACEFIRQAALGLDHAHRQQMVHRDIKPANIMVTWPDPSRPPAVKVLDMGLARLVRDDSEADLTGDSASWGDSLETGVTQAGQIVGTPDYLAPEQILGSREVDRRCDIFGLGCTLFKLLTCQLPFSGRNLAEKMQARINPAAPPPPGVRSFRPDVPPPLETIVSRMVARDPEQRFQDAASVAEALTPFSLASDSAVAATAPVQPPPLPATVKLETDDTDSDTRAFFKLLAHQQPTAGSGVAAPPVVHAPSGYGAHPVAATSSDPAKPFEEFTLYEPQQRPGRRRGWVAALLVTAVCIGGLYALAKAGSFGLAMPSTAVANSAPEDAIPPATPVEEPPLRQEPLRTYTADQSKIVAVAISAGGQHAILATQRNTVMLQRLESDSPVFRVTAPQQDITALALSARGSLAASGSQDGTLALWNIETRRAMIMPRAAGTIEELAFSPDGSQIILRDTQQGVSVWTTARPEKPELVHRFEGDSAKAGRILAIGFGPQGPLVLTGAGAAQIRGWNLKSREEFFRVDLSNFNDEQVVQARFSADAQALAWLTDTGTLRVWDLDSLHELGRFSLAQGKLQSFALSNQLGDGRLVAGAGDVGPVHVWHVHQGDKAGIVHTSIPEVRMLAWLPDGRMLVGNRALELWNPRE